MKRNWAYLLVLMFFCSSTLLSAQEKSGFLKTLGKVAKALTEESTNESGSSGEKSFGSQSSNDKANQDEKKESSDVKITTPHSNFSLEFRNCKVQGNNVEIDLLITNKSSEDIQLNLWEFTAFDNLGNQYSNITVHLGDKKGRDVTNTLPKNIPVKIKIIIPGIDTDADKLARINLRSGSGYFTLENISIQR